jgi:hypothetical protein
MAVARRGAQRPQLLRDEIQRLVPADLGPTRILVFPFARIRATQRLQDPVWVVELLQ